MTTKKPHNKLMNKLNQNTPSWFRKIKKAVGIISDATIVILLGMGYAEDSLILLVIRVGVSSILNTIEIFLSEAPDA